MESNLIISFDPAHAGKAQDEAEALLKEAGEKADFLKSEIEGLFLLKTISDPKKVIKKLTGICKSDPSKFVYTFHWTPIEKWFSSDMAKMQDAMVEIDKKMDPEKKWKMDLSKRQYEGNTTSLIMKLTEKIGKPKVDLKDPDVIVKVEIIGEKAGISLLNTDEYLNVPKIKGK
jgi:tRNA(Ser,Leu) C12 N-acetylase TAN1